MGAVAATPATNGRKGALSSPAAKTSTTPSSVANGVVGPLSRFALTDLRVLLEEPDIEVPYLVESLLPAGGTSLLAAKPKVGKSTLARNLALAVARGEPFLGRVTVSGRVVYLALEEKRLEVKQHFRRMGASAEQISVHVGSAPDAALLALQAALDEHSPSLAIIDPLFKLVRIRDVNDYAEVSRALEPVIDLARATSCHLLCVHHLGKQDRDGGDGLLGSTAIFGAVDAALIMRRRAALRVVESIQRYGEDLPETVVQLDPETGIVTPGGELATLQLAEAKGAVLVTLGGDELPEAAIRERVGGNQTLAAKALRALVEEGRVERFGEGRRGAPYRYRQAAPSEPEQPTESSITRLVPIENRANRDAEEEGEL